MLRNDQNHLLYQIDLCYLQFYTNTILQSRMALTSADIDLLISQQSIFHTYSTQFGSEMHEQQSILYNQFTFSSYCIHTHLFKRYLKLTFESPIDGQNIKSLYLKLDYSTKVVQIRDKKDDPFAKKIGLSFYKDQSTTYDFYHSDSDMIDRWMDQLSKIIFLGGFSYQYKSKHYIGRGQFAQVWQVQRIKDGTVFAAKIIDKDICFGQVNGQQALYNEIQILKRLDHPNIVHLECVYQSERSVYILLEYIQGDTFPEFLNKGKQFSIYKGRLFQKQHKIKIMKGLLKAVDYLHKIGIAHRDLKPGNIIVNDQTYTPYIIDFGLSQFTQNKQHLFECCGSPGYMAPQLYSEETIKKLQKSDIFSLGALFYMLLTGRPLFEGRSVEQLISLGKNTHNLIGRKLHAQFQGNQANILMQMLESDPSKRINASEALEHDYFIQFVYEELNEVRKSISDASSKQNSSEQQNHHNRFEQLFSESIVSRNLKSIIQTATMGTNASSAQSDGFQVTLKTRSKRYGCEQNIDVDISALKKHQNITWSGRCKKLRTLETLEMLIRKRNFWLPKDLSSTA